jgi:hypothetical protein
MSPSLRRLLLFFLGLALLIQLIPYGRDHTNPPVLAEPAWDSPRTRLLFMQVCGDCHSNQTVWPWYSQIAPLSWSIYNHVWDGRSRFNISEWGRPENQAGKSVELYIHDEMPLQSYLYLHPSALLPAPDRQALIDGMFATFGSDFRRIPNN